MGLSLESESRIQTLCGKVAMGEKAGVRIRVEEIHSGGSCPSGLQAGVQACANILKSEDLSLQQCCRSYRFHLVLLISSVPGSKPATWLTGKSRKQMHETEAWSQKSRSHMLSNFNYWIQQKDKAQLLHTGEAESLLACSGILVHMDPSSAI